ncbi:MAG TPA: hypothetical protein VF482_14760, partial [Trebonia sp.]
NAPFGGGSAASVLYRVVMRPPDLAGVSAQLREVVTACLAKNPSERPGLTSLAAMISRAGPAVPAASPDSYWPAPVAEVIRASQAGISQAAISQAAPQAGVAQQPAPAAAGTHTMTAQQAPTMAPPTVMPPPTAPWPQPSSGTPWPQPSPAPDVMAQYRPGGPYRAQAARPWGPVPGSVRTAVWLMRAGAAVSLVNVIVELAIIGQLKTAFMAQHPLAAPKTVSSAAGLAALAVIVGGAIGITLWLWLASAVRRGRGWARTVGTVFFGIDTLGLLATLGRPGIGAIKGIGVVIWLIGLAAVITLWRRQSSQYLRLPAQPNDSACPRA